MAQQNHLDGATSGAHSLVHSLLLSGVDTCFANPGTSEMHFVAALDRIAGIRCVLGLQENIVTGMADGYYRLARKPACTLMHCGPGLANGLANLHNARRAGSGIVNIVGDQATYHQPYDAPLTADTDSLARTVSSWVRTSYNAAAVGSDAAAAVQAAKTSPGQIATLILPADASWSNGGRVAQALPVPAPAAIDPSAVQRAARILRGSEKVLLLLAGSGVSVESQQLAWQIARDSGAAILADYVNACIPRGQGRLQLERVPYSSDAAIKTLGGYRHIILVNAKPPVSFFAYPGKPSVQYAADAQLHVLSRPDQDGEAALRALADELDVPPCGILVSGPKPEVPRGKPTPEGLARMVGAIITEGAIISDESLSYGRSLYPFTHAAESHDWLHLTGGAIGDGMPVATGAAIATAGQRRVISLQADGSAMYSVQTLWTQARERLPVTTIILNNAGYKILVGEYRLVGAEPGETAMRMLDLTDPNLDWLRIASGMGVEAARATTLEQCAELATASFARAGPFLIELVI